MPAEIIAVDPGREKCGVAVVQQTGKVIYQAVLETSGLAARVQALAEEHNVNIIVLGDRTSRQSAEKVLKAIIVNGRPVTVIAVDEHHSTDEARKRYWQDNPPRGLKRLIPVTLQVPPYPVDDLSLIHI